MPTTIDASATSFDALAADINLVNSESAGVYEIDINGASGSISLTGALSQIQLQTGVTLNIVGENGATLDGQNDEPGLYVYSGTVSISDLTIQNAVAQGQPGTRQYGGGGGGHAGLGGGLFVGSKAAVTLDQVTFKTDAAIGGNGGAGVNYAFSNSTGGTRPGRGGNSGFQSESGYSVNGHPGKAGPFGQGGGGGGGGAGGLGAIGGYYSGSGNGGAGGAGGFGGEAGAAGGRGVGSRMTSHTIPVQHHNSYITTTTSGAKVKETYVTTSRPMFPGTVHGHPGKGGSGGGGLGAGGDVYVQGGGTLKILGGSLSGTATGGSGAHPGAGLGGSIFLQGDETLHLAPAASQTLTVDDSIADQAGYDSHYSADAGKLDLDGAGTVQLNAASTFVGGVTLSDGTLELDAPGAAGKGAITFLNTSAHPGLVIDAAATPGDGQTFSNAIAGFGPGDAIDLRGLGYAAGATAQRESGNSNILDVTSNGVTVKFNLSNAQSSTFVVKDDGVVNAATGKDGAIVEAPTIATSFDILAADINQANAWSAGTYVIEIDGASGPIALTGALPEINLQAGVTLDIVGENGAILDGQGDQSGLYVYSGTVSISDLTIQNATAQGQAGTQYYDGGGGGHAGLGGGLFVGAQAAVTLDKVTFKSDAAVGGHGGAGVTYGSSLTTAAGTRPGRGGGDRNGYDGHPGHTGSFGQGGGGGGGGIGGSDIGLSVAGNGGAGGAGGFGGGAGAGGHPGVASTYTVLTTTHNTILGSPTHGHINNVHPGHPGKGGSGGGGLGAGGDVYVQGGGTLKILGGSLSGTATGGSGANPGAGLGGAIFLQGDETLHVAPAASQTLTVNGSIADQAGYDSHYSADAGKLDLDGAGTVQLNAASTFVGGVTLSDGTLELDAPGAAGKGAITFLNTSAHPGLVIDAAATPGDGQTFSNTIAGFGPGDAINLRGLGYAAGATAQRESGNSNILDVTSNGVTVKFNLSDAQLSTFVVKDDGVVNAATGKDGAIVEAPTIATSFDILAADINQANAQSAGTYVIEIDGASGPIALTGALPEINLQTGVTLDIVGENGAILDGQGDQSGLYVYQGAVSISDLIIQNATAQGQAGTQYYDGGGGGHAGLGGGLFVGAQAAVTLDKVTFKSDAAIGGNGGAGVTNGMSATSAGTRPGRGGGNKYGTNGHPGHIGSFGQGGGGGAGGIGGGLGLSRAGQGGAGGAGGFGGGAGAAGHPGVASTQTVMTTTHTYDGSPTQGHVFNTHQGHDGKGGSGGGGLGAGGDVYVQGGGMLKILGGSLSGSARGGLGANPGAGLGGSIFLQGREKLELAPAASQTLTVDDSVADQAGYDNRYRIDPGQLLLDGAGTVQLNAASTFVGGITLSDGTLELGAQGAAGVGAITLVNATVHPRIVIDAAATPGDGQTFSNTLADLGVGDVIDLRGLGYQAGATAELETGDSSILDVTSNGEIVKFTLYNGQPNNFVVKSDGVVNLATGMDGVIVEAPCYRAGTRILTNHGEVAVEDLAVGDIAVTASRQHRPIQWIGRRRVDIAKHLRPETVRPVRIIADALGEGLPVRDLYLSPDHALWLEGSLVPVRGIVNGASIRQETASAVEYFHVELETHDILLAEGVPAESYLDCDNRGGFENAPSGVVMLHPEWSAKAASRPFASPASTARLKAAFADRAVSIGRAAELQAYEAAQRARGRVARANVIRNPRAEGARPGRIGAGGQAPTHWWFNAPKGIEIEVIGHGDDNGLPFIDIRLVGRADAPGHASLYPEPGKTAPIAHGEDWTISCHLRRLRGSADGLRRLNLYIDELGSAGAYLTGRAYPQPMPTTDDLSTQRVSATRRIVGRETTGMTGYIHIEIEAGAPIDVTLRLAAPQIEQGDYASDLMLPALGEFGPTNRQGPAQATLPLMRKVV